MPTTPGAIQTTYSGGGFFVSRDAFVTKLDAAGSALVYSTYLGGSGNDYGSGIAVDAAGSAYVSGSTGSTDFPTANPSQAAYGGGVREGGGNDGADAFVSKLDATGSALLYSTYLGGSSNESGRGIAVDAAGAAYVTGFTKSTDFTAGCTAPCTVLDGTFSGRSTPFGVPYDAFVAKIADMSSTPGTVSLWGFIASAGNITVPLLGIGPVPGANFGGTVQFNSGDPSPTGDVRYIDLVTGADIAATSFTTLVIGAGPCGADTHALIIGKATVNGVPDQDLQVDVDDCSEPSSQPPDTLMITTGSTQVYANGGPLVVGNIQVKKAQ